MRRLTQTAALILIALLLTACATNPVNRWAQARDTLTRSQDSVILAHQAGLISDETLVAADPIAQSARAALAKAEESLPEGGSGFEHYLAIVDSMIDRLIAMAAAGELLIE